MLAIPFLNSFASNAILGAITTKVLESIITSKTNTKLEQQKWLRNTKLNLFSKLWEEVTLINNHNQVTNYNNIKTISSKIILLTNNKSLQIQLENYIFILNEYPNYKEINLHQINNELLYLLSKNIKQI
jgi:hypothetical protein